MCSRMYRICSICRECFLERRHEHAADAGKQREREWEGREGRDGGRMGRGKARMQQGLGFRVWGLVVEGLVFRV